MEFHNFIFLLFRWKSAENLYQGSYNDDLKEKEVSKGVSLLSEEELLPQQREASPPVGSGEALSPATEDVPSPEGEVEMKPDAVRHLSDAASKESEKSGKKTSAKSSSSSSKKAAKAEKSGKKFGKKDKKDKKSYSSGDSKANTDTEEYRQQQARASRSISVNDRVGYETVKEQQLGDSGSSTYSHNSYRLLSKQTSSSSYGSSVPKSHKSDNLNVSTISSSNSASGLSPEFYSVSGGGCSASSSEHNKPYDHHSSGFTTPYGNNDHHNSDHIAEEGEGSPPTSPMSLPDNGSWQDAVEESRFPSTGRSSDASRPDNLDSSTAVYSSNNNGGPTEGDNGEEAHVSNGHKVNGMSCEGEEGGRGDGGDSDSVDPTVAIIHPLLVVNPPTDLNGHSNRLGPRIRSYSLTDLYILLLKLFDVFGHIIYIGG